MKEESWIKRGLKNEFKFLKQPKAILLLIGIIGVSDIAIYFGANRYYLGFFMIILGLVLFYYTYKGEKLK